MKSSAWQSGSRLGWRIGRVGALAGTVVTLGALTAPGCLNRPIEPVEPRTTSTIVERLTQSAVDKIDLVLNIDNSRSMADKQRILELAVPKLIEPLVNPKCVDPKDGDLDFNDDGTPDPVTQPAGPLEVCPMVTVSGSQFPSKREFEPVVDFHIGVLSSSIGAHGANVCDLTPTENDRGHLLSRTDAATPGTLIDTYPYGDPANYGFLDWDPTGLKSTPPGEASLANLTDNLRQMVVGVGEVGCGFEAPLESWYRFLVDPNPYNTIEVQKINNVDTAVLIGTDQELLTQRAQFLRPDSLLAVIMLTDENDCSIRDGGQYFFAGQIYAPGTTSPYHLPKARAACATNPNDPCCRSCGQPAAAGCNTTDDPCPGNLDPVDDQINVRCFEQKRRFGIDFLQPLDRYVTGLTAALVPDRAGNLVQNPLFTDLDPTDQNSNIRDAGLIFLGGIVGVPWQDIARRDANGVPNLLTGLDASGNPVGGLQSGDELVSNGTWDVILGDLLNYVPPSDPLMVESIDPRVGTNPVTGDALVGVGPNTPTNPINGKEWSVVNKKDLQYACVFDLGACATAADCGGGFNSCVAGRCVRDCTNTNIQGCDCADPANDNPLCWNGSAFGTDQYGAKGYPGRRELHVLKQLGDQGIVGSICPAQMDDDTAPDFGYTPAVQAIVDRLKQALGGQCLPRSLTANLEGQVPCLIIEAKQAVDGCSGGAGSRRPVAPENQAAADAAAADPANPGWKEYCEIIQLSGAELDKCQNDPADDGTIDGWCYVDPTTVPPVGNAEIVASCPSTEKRIIRFVGQGKGAPGATLFITCAGE
ncbi:MAG: hypothetical protein IT373_36605 [Polyangiaceae bacterium]|nr:hypothetical protein [Polyangiaceae bacterium]